MVTSMWVVEVIPLARGLRRHETLSYYTSLSVEPGDMVRVPLRNKSVPALVVSATPLAQAKAQVRKAPFRLKRLSAKTARPWIPPAFIAAVQEEARWNVAPLGPLLRATIAQALIDVAAHLKEESPPPRPSAKGGRVAALQETTVGRLREYHTLVRESFARKESVLILAPTIEEAEEVASRLERGIAPYVVLLHSGLSARALREALREALTQPHPLAIVATPAFLAIPRNDIRTLILERESSSFYLLPSHPRVHLTQLAERYALLAGWRVIRADLPLTVITYKRLQEGEAEPVGVVSARVLFPTPLRLVSLRHARGEALPPANRNERERRAIVSKELEEALRATFERGGKAVLFATRRGHAPLTVCDDCGASVVCDSCGAAMVTHRQGTTAYFLCHACGAMRAASEACLVCGSWRLTSLGVATGRVAHILHELFPSLPVFIIDSDHTPKRAQAHKAIAEFAKSGPAALVGTQKMLPLLQMPVELTAIVSFDTVLSLPSWNVEERALSIGFALREIAKQQTIVQTRMPTDTPLFQALAEGHLRPWYRETLALRERLGYPPFAVIVRVSVVGSRATLARDVARAEALLPEAYYSGKSRVFGMRARRFVQHLYLRFPAHQWPNDEVIARLKELPPSAEVAVNPPSIIT